MTIPTLETKNLILKPLSIDCEKAYLDFYTDSEASRHYNGPLTPAASWSRLAADIGVWSLQGFGVWGIHRREQNDVVGVCGFWQTKGWPRELTWWLLPEARGQGIALEASNAAIAHAYGIFGWDAVETYMNDDNVAARGLTIKLGANKIDRRMFPDGLERDIYRFPKPASS